MEKNKKIGIVTLSEWTPNYGARLQYFAVQTIFESLGWRVEMIQDARWSKNPIRVSSYKREILHVLCPWYKYNPEKHAFPVQILLFIKRYFHVSPIVINEDADMNKLDAQYDMFCAGSDQVWNPYFNTRGLNSFTTLQFTIPNKRASYAASIATKEMLPERADEFASFIRDFRAISVREEDGARIIKELLGRNVLVHIDPTLMFTGKEWIEKLRLGKYVRKKDYILVFVYGQLTEDVMSQAEKVCQRLRINKESIIYFNKLRNFSDWSMKSWLNYIRGAKYVITNSFHCTVFATLFHVPFISIHHQHVEQMMGSRIKNLVKICNLPYAHIEGAFDEVHDVDWNVVENNLNIKRAEAWKYLKDTFV